MALLFMDSFDHYLTADILTKWTASGINNAGSSAISIAAVGRHSSNGVRLGLVNMSSGGLIYINKTVTTSDPTCILGFAYGHGYSGANVISGWAIAGIRESAGHQISLCISPSNTLSVKRGDHQGTLLGSTSVALPFGVFTYVELKVLIHPSAGTVEVRFNGTTVLSLTGQNTRSTANATWNTIVLGTQPSNTVNTVASSNGNMDYDDLYICDSTGAAPWNNFLGDCRVDPRYPTGAGATTGWTPSAGSNFQNVDDATPNADTDYNQATGVATDTFVVQDVPVTGAILYGVQHCMITKKSDAGAATIAPVVRHSGVDNVGADLYPGTSYVFGTVAQQVNPGTSAQWTEAGFNAAEFGYKRTS